jgi:hydrogenase expression/formation protein HypE
MRGLLSLSPELTMTEINLTCPIPISDYPNVLLAHGGGGRLTHQLIERMFAPLFGNPELDAKHDGAVLQIGNTRLAFTTDSYVVQPLFFPGGDIGSLAVHGTVNDLAMCGARPLYLSVGFVIEEGLPMEALWKVAQSLQRAARAANVQIVTGDTKVVDKGKADGVFINTTGIGIIDYDGFVAPQSVRPSDVVIISGDVGRHGMAVMAVREGLEFETTIESDSAPVADLVYSLMSADIEVHCLRDLTRGGLASALNEIAEAAGVAIHIDETRVPVREDVRAACEILGFDPFYVACEGRFVAFVPPQDGNKALAIMRSRALGETAQAIGSVEQRQNGAGSHFVTMRSKIGTTRIVDMLSGEQLPRIC